MKKKWTMKFLPYFRESKTEKYALEVKKTRGFGKFKLMSVFVWNYEKVNYLEYADAYNEDLKIKEK